MNINDTNIDEAIKFHWKLRVNPLHPEDGPDYPAQLSAFVPLEIDGEQKMFRVVIREFNPPEES